MSISKIEEGKIDLKTEQFDLEALIESVLNDCAARAYTNSLELILRYPHSVPREFFGDQSRIFEALGNLVQNAIKFTPSGYILVNVSLDSEDSSPGMLHIDVTDTGLGISTLDQERIFEKFTKLGASDESNFHGTGLGLAITKNLATLMQGSLNISSSPGKGTTFSLAIPLSFVPRTKTSKHSSKGNRVLIVSDNSVFYEALHCGLSYEGLQCEGAEDYTAAQLSLSEAKAAGTPFDAIVINEPPYTKKEASQELPVFTIPCFLLQLPIEFRDTEFDPVNDTVLSLEKPISPSRLEETLRQHVRQPEPANLDTDPATGTPAVSPGIHSRQYKILLVEDKEINQKVMRALLKKIGYDIEVASNGRLAIELLSQNTYDLVFMDCKMPIMDGYMTTRQIRKLNTPMKMVPVIAMSAHALYGAREKCLAAGMDDYVSKPVGINDIQAVLDRWLK